MFKDYTKLFGAKNVSITNEMLLHIPISQGNIMWNKTRQLRGNATITACKENQYGQGKSIK